MSLGPRTCLLNHAAPIADIGTDLRQLALVGFRSAEQIWSSARMATLEECRQIGAEQGAADAREIHAAAPADVEDLIFERMLQRLRNLMSAGLESPQLNAFKAAYVTAATGVVGERYLCAHIHSWNRTNVLCP